MNTNSDRELRCAVYTRVSDDKRLGRVFNSIDAQYDAGKAYIRSQAHARWVPVADRYDDGGFSGGNTDRPALQRLCQDVRLGRVDVILVYKLDRFTRSLRDFVNLIQLFDWYQVTFVAVTQPFNTTTSMGRLLVNVLLSFAQFEREVAAERVRDKIAASKRNGVWAGGPIALGYETHNGNISINENEAWQVRLIFNKYLEFGTLRLVLEYLAGHGILTRDRVLKSGQIRKGYPFSFQSLGCILRNRCYVGDVVFKGEVLRGPQPSIIDRATFNTVQLRLDRQRCGANAGRQASLLA